MLGKIRVSSKEILNVVDEKYKTMAQRSLKIHDRSKIEKALNDVSILKRYSKDDLKKLSAYKNRPGNKELQNAILQSPDMIEALHDEKHNKKIIAFRFAAYTKKAFFASRRFAYALELLGVKYSGPIGLPTKTKRYTLLRSPFKYKKFQEAWELKTWRSIVALDTEGIDDLTPKIIDYCLKTTYPGVEVKITTHRFIPHNQIYIDPYIKENLAIEDDISTIHHEEVSQ